MEVGPRLTLYLLQLVLIDSRGEKAVFYYNAQNTMSIIGSSKV
jgi:hypothetical protein